MKRGTNMKIIPAAVLALFSGYASASGFQLIEQNGSGLGNAYAGSAAVAENASTIFYNPAGMTQLQGREVSAGLVVVQPSFKFSNNGSNVGSLANTGSGGDGGQLGLLPNGYLSWGLNKDLYLGLGVGAPFGLMTEYTDPWIGANQSIKFDVKTYNINPSVAYRVNDVVSVGGGLNWQKFNMEYLAAPGTLTTNFANGVAKLTGSDSAWGWNAGALFTLSQATKVGVSYRSSIKYDIRGNAFIDGTAGVVGAVTAVGKTGGWHADLKMPDTFILSVTQKLSDRWEMLGDYSWTGWGKIPKIDVMMNSGILYKTLDTNFRNTSRVALGANYKLDDAWKLKFGIAYDQTPVKGEATRMVSLPDNDRTWLSVGAQWLPSKDAKVDFGAAYLFVKDAKINNNQNGAVPSAANTVTGTYKDSCWILGAQYSQAF
jgi:long-chain fatty acid transport protein